MTSMTSIPPKAEQRFAISFETRGSRFAKRAFEAYLMSSAVRVFAAYARNRGKRPGTVLRRVSRVRASFPPNTMRSGT